MKQRAILFFFIGIMTGILQAQTLTLKDAGQLFLKQNLSLIAARYDMDIAQAQVLQARLFENPVISLEQNVYNRLNGKYFDMGKDGESGVEIEQVISIAGQRSNRIRLEKVNKEMAGYQFQEIMRTLHSELNERFVETYFLQRSLGYSILGMSNEECMFILHGKTTRNGKSTLLNTIETMLGDYAKVAPVGMICRGDRQKDAEAASPTLAGLKGKRFVTMSESNEYGKLDEEKIKQFTGGEEISARALYQSAITYKPQFTLWLSCNDLPMVTDKSLFASERIKVIEFNRHFSPAEQDTHLKDELTSQEAMSGIFMWLVRGYIKYKEHGLAMSESLRSVVTKYERENDLVLQFLENRCVRVPEDENNPFGEKGKRTNIKAKDLYQAFKMWAKSEGAYVLSARKFNSEMERHPEWFDRKSTSSGFVIYWGLKLKEIV